MRTVKYFLLMALSFSLVGLGAYQAEEKKDKDVKYTIKEVMRKAHTAKKGEEPLFKKVAGGTATKEQKEQLLELYTALSKNKPPKGDMEDWAKKTKALMTAAKDVLTGKEGGEAELKKELDCMSCHMAFRIIKKK